MQPHQKEILRQIALENVNLINQGFDRGDEKAGLPIWTKYNLPDLPCPETPSEGGAVEA